MSRSREIQTAFCSLLWIVLKWSHNSDKLGVEYVKETMQTMPNRFAVLLQP